MRLCPVCKVPGIVLWLMVLVVCTSSVAEDTIRCGSNLVETGAWPAEVREVCGDPDYAATYPQRVLDGFGRVHRIEHWYYEHGANRFVRRLVFRAGELRRIETLERGSSGNRSCSAHDIREGMSQFELLRRCGEPEQKRFDWHVTHGRGHATSARPVAEWLYSFGSNRFRQVVRLENGDVTRIQRRDKPD